MSGAEVMGDEASDTIAFAEKVLLLLDQGSFTATYKFAVLLAMIDVCMERTAADGRTPRTVSARELASKTIDLYWPQTAPFAGNQGAVVLRQNAGGQAAIITAIRRFRERIGEGARSPARARRTDPRGFEWLVGEVEWKLIQMPLPRLQVFGGEVDRFLYDFDWDVEVRRGAIASGEIDVTLRLNPGVGERLVRLGGLLRPLIQRQWTERVARFNRRDVAEFGLEEFLFGVPRLTTARLVDGLRELQEGACFYCNGVLDRIHVDHFIPWARHPDDGIHNLVLAHPRCNGDKRDFLAAAGHVERWDARFAAQGSDLAALADEERWASHADRTHSVARAIYLRLPANARLWQLERSFVEADLQRLHAVLTRSGSSVVRDAAETPARYVDGPPE